MSDLRGLGPVNSLKQKGRENSPKVCLACPAASRAEDHLGEKPPKKSSTRPSARWKPERLVILSICPSARLSVLYYLSVCLCVCWSVSVNQSVRESIHPSIHPASQPASQPASHPSIHPSIRRSINPSLRLCLSVYRSIFLAICLSSCLAV